MPGAAKNVVVTRNTSVFREYYGITNAEPRLIERPVREGEEAPGQEGEQPAQERVEGDDDQTVHSSDTDDTAHTEPLSDVEEDGGAVEADGAGMPPLIPLEEGEKEDDNEKEEEEEGMGQVGATLNAATTRPPRYLPTSTFVTYRWNMEPATPLMAATPDSVATSLQSPFSDIMTPVSAQTAPSTTPTTNRVNSLGTVLSSPATQPTGGVNKATTRLRKGLVSDEHSDLYGDMVLEQQNFPLDGYGNTSLLVAAKMDDVKAVYKMLKAKWDPTIKNDYGEGILHQAVWGSNDCMAGILVNLVRDLGLDINTANILQRTPLHTAVMHGNITMMTELLSLGADMGARDRAGQTPLHLAVVHRKGEAVSLLLSRGCPVDVRDNQGNTALHLATMYDATVIVDELVAYGADRNLRNDEGETPVSLAEMYGHEWVSRFFSWHSEDDADGPRKPRGRASSNDKLKKQQAPIPGTNNKLSIKLRVAGQEVVYDDVEMVEVAGDHNLEALVPSVA